jgi:hypothetical protein
LSVSYLCCAKSLILLMVSCCCLRLVFVLCEVFDSLDRVLVLSASLPATVGACSRNSDDLFAMDVLRGKIVCPATSGWINPQASGHLNFPGFPRGTAAVVAVAVGHNSPQMEATLDTSTVEVVGQGGWSRRSPVSRRALYVHGCFCVFAPAGYFDLALSGSCFARRGNRSLVPRSRNLPDKLVGFSGFGGNRGSWVSPPRSVLETMGLGRRPTSCDRARVIG